MDNDGKRRVGRPRLAPQSGPLVLEGGRARVKVELEIAQKTAEELKEYVRWVEVSSALAATDALFKTADSAFRDVFRRDRLWQEQRKHREDGDSPTSLQALPAVTATASPLPPPAQIPRPIPNATVPPLAQPARSPKLRNGAAGDVVATRNQSD